MDSLAVARDSEIHEATRRVLSVLLRQVKLGFGISLLLTEHVYLLRMHTRKKSMSKGKCLGSLTVRVILMCTCYFLLI